LLTPSIRDGSVNAFSGLNGPGGVFGFYAPGTPPLSLRA
jgi:hypothetical protein